MKFCSACGSGRLERAVPEGDDRLRAVCLDCGAIHYENPRNVVGCLVEQTLDGGRDGLLLCRRAIEPCRGLWTLPAGFLELGESTIAGAARETLEEANAKVRVTAPFATLDLVHIGQVYHLFRAQLSEPGFSAGPESLEVRWFGLDELPYGELAFPVMHIALELYTRDVADRVPRLHAGALHWNGEGSRFDARNYRLDRDLLLDGLHGEAGQGGGAPR